MALELKACQNIVAESNQIVSPYFSLADFVGVGTPDLALARV